MMIMLSLLKWTTVSIVTKVKASMTPPFNQDTHIMYIAAGIINAAAEVWHFTIKVFL